MSRFFCWVFLCISCFASPYTEIFGDAALRPPTASYSLTKVLPFSSENKLLGHLITHHSHLWFFLLCSEHSHLHTPQFVYIKEDIFARRVNNMLSIWRRRINIICCSFYFMVSFLHSLVMMFSVCLSWCPTAKWKSYRCLRKSIKACRNVVICFVGYFSI